MRRHTGETCTWPCRWCGTLAECRRYVDECGDAAWERAEHLAPCGLPCRPLSTTGKAHRKRWCSTCGVITPRRRKELLRIEKRRRARAARRKAA